MSQLSQVRPRKPLRGSDGMRLRKGVAFRKEWEVAKFDT